MITKKLPGPYLYKCRKCGSIYASNCSRDKFKPFKCFVCNSYKHCRNEDLYYFDLTMLAPPVDVDNNSL